MANCGRGEGRRQMGMGQTEQRERNSRLVYFNTKDGKTVTLNYMRLLRNSGKVMIQKC